MPSTLRRTTITAAFAVLILYGGLILSLGWFLEGAVFRGMLFSERSLFAIRLSLITATISSCMALIIAIPAAYALSRYRFWGSEAINTLLEFPIIVSPAALGAILLMFFSSPLGEWVQAHTVRFVFGFAGILLAQFVTVLGVAVRLLKASFDEIPVEIEVIARTLGATPRYAFFTVVLPLARRGILAAFVLSWAKALGEFGATVTLAGTMAMRTETLPVAIYLRLASADIEGTAALILIMVGIGLCSLYLARRLLQRSVDANRMG